jgi:ribosomal protein S27AE
MSSENCPRCGAGSVYATNVYDRDLQLPTSESTVMSVKAVINQAVETRHLLCGRCGYLETYVVDRKFLEQLPRLQAWVKV